MKTNIMTYVLFTTLNENTTMGLSEIMHISMLKLVLITTRYRLETRFDDQEINHNAAAG
jgi:hypothetical protein